ncbi:ubiquinol-cytochrome-c reductase complex assembly factor 2-like [Chelonia mydas]|uniref:ubiquinol-cytochrome-c reductase complex assembly factor 2-like n=1 Tax=Chelonia mydas TaxID=8469 RepID=UPI001CA7C81B|nr:ubiquinol-cytochrome-c reductase complex assembly factor 2-like [Chelonia mydas]
MAATRCRRFPELCEEWPVEGTKRVRDLGAFPRQRGPRPSGRGRAPRQAQEEKSQVAAGWMAQGKGEKMESFIFKVLL